MSYEESSTMFSQYLPANGHVIDFNQNLSEEEAKAQWRELKEDNWIDLSNSCCDFRMVRRKPKLEFFSISKIHS